PVVHRHGLPRAEDEERDSELRELRVSVPLEPAHEPTGPAVPPLRIARVDYEPSRALRDEPVLDLLERSFWDAHARTLTEMERSLPVARRPRRPEWMKVRAPSADSRYFEVRSLIHGQSLHTICEEARCPNISECWGRGTATFQILGDTCTRACRYCYVNSG